MYYWEFYSAKSIVRPKRKNTIKQDYKQDYKQENYSVPKGQKS
jgi:hypothetical protein